jgi:RND family efflux transporter MFP subunit
MASKSRLGLKAVIVLVALVLMAFFAVHLSRPVAKVVAVKPDRAVDAVPGSVTVRAERDEDLRHELGGFVARSELDDGKFVKAGEFLLQLDPGDLELVVERIESDYEAAKKRVAVGSQIALDLETERAELENAERLNKMGGVSDSDLQKQRRLVAQIEKKLALEQVANDQLLKGLENDLKTKRRQLEKMTVKAPFDCVISKVYARPNALINGGAPIATLISVNRTVEAKISEENFSGIQIGQRATVRFLGYDEIYEATVAKILPTADPETQRYLVHLDVKIPAEKLVPGITGEVSIVVGERDSRTVVPRRALFGHNCYVVKDGRVELRQLQLGFVSLNRVEIIKGLSEGELVIVEEVDRFHDGDRVRVSVSK